MRPTTSRCSLLIFLLVPEAATQRHLEILSEIAEMLSDRELRERLKTEARRGQGPRADRQLGTAEVGGLTRMAAARRVKPSVISAEALFEEHRPALQLGVDRRATPIRSAASTKPRCATRSRPPTWSAT